MQLCCKSLSFPLYPFPFPHEKYTYFDFKKDAESWRPRRHQALDQIGRNLGMEKLRSALLQFLQGNAAVQAAQLRANSPGTNLLHLRGQRLGNFSLNFSHLKVH